MFRIVGGVLLLCASVAITRMGAECFFRAIFPVEED